MSPDPHNPDARHGTTADSAIPPVQQATPANRPDESADSPLADETIGYVDADDDSVDIQPVIDALAASPTPSSDGLARSDEFSPRACSPANDDLTLSMVLTDIGQLRPNEAMARSVFGVVPGAARPQQSQQQLGALYWISKPDLNPADIARWMAYYTPNRVLQVDRASDPHRREQATLRVHTDAATYAMKVYTGDERRLRRLNRIYRMMQTCRQHGFPCPRPLPLSTGKHLLRDGPLSIGVYDWLDGESLLRSHASTVRRMSPAQARSAGGLLGRWHRLVGELVNAEMSWSLPPFLASVVERYYQWKAGFPSPPAAFEPIFARLAADIEWLSFGLNAKPLRLQWTHGDATVRNFMFDGDEAIALIDFDLAAIAPRLFDLVILLQAQPEQMHETLYGYRQAAELRRSERRALPILAGTRLIQRMLDSMPQSLDSAAQREQFERVYLAYRQVKLNLRELALDL